jgi:polyhydroxybutyrate depolymerase
MIAGGDRPVTVHVPPGLDPAGAPLLILLHGYTASGAMSEQYLRLRRVAEAACVVYAFPDGTRDRRGNRFWNATDVCCDFGRTGVDDERYLADLIREITSMVAVDPRRVYLIGHSNGGFMAHRMACAHADLVAAIVSFAGVTYADEADCDPSEPVAILQVHGTADESIDYEGGRLTDIGDPTRYPSVEETIATWLTFNGCDDELTETATRRDVDARIDGPDGPAEAIVGASTGCRSGGFVELWTIPDGRHVPALAPTFSSDLLDFLLAHPKP